MVGFNTYELRTLRNEQTEALERLAEMSQANINSAPAAAALESANIQPKVQIWSPRVCGYQCEVPVNLIAGAGEKKIFAPNAF